MNGQRRFALGIAVLVIASATSAPAVAASPTDFAQWNWPWEDDEWDDDDVDPGEVTVSGAAALETAANETGATPVELELGTADGTPAYEVLTVGPENASTVVVDATDGTVVRTESVDDDEVEELEAFDVSALRPASEAVGFATNETNGTVTEVELQTDEGFAVYRVDLVASNGTETTVFVAATDGPVLGVHTEDESGESDETDESRG